eukprot:TRINITY_DN7524_c1_g1_i1.p1 TRINITY_DN7524_c1_g1~~TRINITY_DN7524_c1_g1_i1.p1  ORF type:complete len:197 (+),score=21.64 TRINITY_DN7524_c1_g1_i1:25-615(+)
MDVNIPGGAENWAIGCAGITCFWWFLSIIVPWYFFEIDTGGVEGRLDCFINGDCEGTGDLNDANIQGDLEDVFEATAAFMIIGFLCFFAVFIILLVKRFWPALQNRNLFLVLMPLMGLICIVFFLAFIIFPSGVTNEFDGEFADDGNGQTRGPSAGWPMSFFLWCCFIPTCGFVYLTNQFTTSFGEGGGQMPQAEG